MKKILILVLFFVGNVRSGIGFWPFWVRLLGPGPQPLEGILWLMCLFETKL